MGRDGAMQLISEEMSNKYFWPNMTFPKMMEERGFPKDKSDGVKNYYYRRVVLVKLYVTGSARIEYVLRFLTGTTVSRCGMRYINMLRGSSNIAILLTK